MFCKSCGNRLGADDAVCPHCGASVQGAARPLPDAQPEAQTTTTQKPVSADDLFAAAVHKAEAASQAKAELPSEEDTLTLPETAAAEEAPAETAATEEAPAAQASAPEETATGESAPETATAEAAPEEMPAAQEAPAAPEAAAGETPAPETAPAANTPDAPTPDDAKAQAPAEQAPHADAQPPAAAPAQPAPPAKPKPTPQPVAAKPARESRKARRAAAWVKVLCVLCALAVAALTGINAYTDVFKTDNDAVKTVALSALPETEKDSCLQFLSRFAPFYGKSIDFKELGHYAFLELLEPGNPGGLYAAFYDVATPETKQADPAGRFTQPDGSSRYYKIPFNHLSQIASQFDLDLIGCANRADYYFYDGNYYFAAADAEPGTKHDATLSLLSSKRTEDGSYYLVCKTPDGTDVYCLVTLTKEGETSVWDLLRLSAEPLFTEDGMPTAIQSGNALDYEMRQRVITAKTTDGTEYATYVIDYPYFTDVTNRTATTINTLYGEIVKSYKEKAQEADESYQKYLKRGYDTKLLPAYTYVLSTVTFDKDGYISLLDEVASYTPETIAKAQKKAQQAAEQAGTEPELPAIPLFPAVTYSGVTVDTKTSEILKKETVFGTDFQTYQDKLATIYAETHNLSADEKNTVGQAIYESTWYLAPDGLRFCYLGGDCVEFVTLPLSEVPYTF